MHDPVGGAVARHALRQAREQRDAPHPDRRGELARASQLGRVGLRDLAVRRERRAVDGERADTQVSLRERLQPALARRRVFRELARVAEEEVAMVAGARDLDLVDAKADELVEALLEGGRLQQAVGYDAELHSGPPTRGLLLARLVTGS